MRPLPLALLFGFLLLGENAIPCPRSLCPGVDIHAGLVRSPADRHSCLRQAGPEGVRRMQGRVCVRGVGAPPRAPLSQGGRDSEPGMPAQEQGEQGWRARAAPRPLCPCSGRPGWALRLPSAGAAVQPRAWGRRVLGPPECQPDVPAASVAGRDSSLWR